MTRINSLRNIAGTRDSVAWGKDAKNVATATWRHINALIFAAVLIVCSLAVGCSSEKPKPVSSNNQIPVTQSESTMPPSMPAVAMQAENKPAPKKVVHKKPATVNYTDKTYGVTFEYPRRYAIETGNAASDLLMSSPVPMNFVQPGGVALAAVELPETSFTNTDFSSAFFNVSVHKNLTADQCTEFAVPQPKIVPVAATETKSEAKSEPEPMKTTPSTEAATAQSASTPAAPATSAETQPVSAPATAVAAATPALQSQPEPQGSKLMLGDLELRATEAVSGEGTRQSDAKYFHFFQNGSCYEFALNVTTVASQDGLIKHVDRDKVFDRLEKILATVKINPITPEVTAETPATPAAPVNPAQ
jgi:hypothetical protein